jgi:hypothetical protein
VATYTQVVLFIKLNLFVNWKKSSKFDVTGIIEEDIGHNQVWPVQQKDASHRQKSNQHGRARCLAAKD